MDKTNVPYYLHEAAMARLTQAIKRIQVAMIILIIALVVNNVVWITAYLGGM